MFSFCSPVKLRTCKLRTCASKFQSNMANKLTEQNLQLAKGLISGHRASLAKCITLIESTRADHQQQATLMFEYLANEKGNIKIKGFQQSGQTLRLGVAGPPGAGKSSLIEVLGLQLVQEGAKVAVIPIDPSSPVSGGSVLFLCI